MFLIAIFALFILSSSIYAQNKNFDGLRATVKVGLLQSNLDKYYGLADGNCSQSCENVQLIMGNRYNWALGNEKRNGAIVGAALGYNWVSSSNFLIGIEGGAYKTFMEYELYGENLQNLSGVQGPVVKNLNLDYLADASLILGGIVGERFLVYGKGGITGGYFSYLDRTNIHNDRVYSESSWVPGYTVGGGIKYAINNRYALGLEYGYTKFNDLVQSTNNTYGAWTGIVTTKQHVNLHAVMATFTIGFGKKAAKIKQPQVVQIYEYCSPEEPKEEEKPNLNRGLTPYSHGFQAPEVGKTIVLDKIYYDFDQDYIRPDAKPELDKVVVYMQAYPNMTIELSSHTDSRGTHLYNEDLSQRRAESAVRYIVERGISPNRIYAKGYGENRLVNHCKDGVFCSEDDHQKNRRTEITILKK
ncbi:MAG: OmpA family protein [Candidatus Elulimicrobiales bacterium]|nr:OmpA family protein [Candidatus Elulimicrobiales bacterium]